MPLDVYITSYPLQESLDSERTTTFHVLLFRKNVDLSCRVLRDVLGVCCQICKIIVCPDLLQYFAAMWAFCHILEHSQNWHGNGWLLTYLRSFVSVKYITYLIDSIWIIVDYTKTRYTIGNSISCQGRWGPCVAGISLQLVNGIESENCMYHQNTRRWFEEEICSGRVSSLVCLDERTWPRVKTKLTISLPSRIYPSFWLLW